MTISIALTWILFLGLFPIAFFWLRRAWRILVRRDFSEVALKRGEPPADPAKYAPYAAAINLVAGGVAVAVILMVVVGGAAYDTWTAIAGSTIWMKFFADFILSRQAHPIWGQKKQAETSTTPKDRR
ncbi:MAG TPA: hypothetical protein PL117_05245 [Accumulibacter sp.]|uniref:hypothetical protein n=1 Tax=Accumulibacter sp. TaxID=2053492 RepID=UPI0026243272|nr:hypothetical protein [Accumulibacter sp.]HRD91808.1 hypothetical protein [Accumulibacter sp.]HRF72160.1 hypothetical protein [Accumulibacter sp.]